MLNILRSATRTWVVKLLLGLIMVAFASWGLSDVFLNVGRGGVARVGDVEISQAQFAQAFQTEMNELNREGRQLTNETAMAAGLHNRVLTRLVYQEVLRQAAEDAGLRVPDDEVIDVIRTLPIFEERGGFDRLTFQQLLLQLNASEAELMEMVRTDETRQLLVETLLGPLTVPRTMVNLYYGYETQTRTIEFFQIAAEDLEVETPTEDELTAFYNDNPDLYTAPEYRDFTVLAIRKEDVARSIDVPEQELRDAYDQAQALYQEPETRAVSQIIVQDEEQARTLYNRISGGESFDAVAADTGRTPEDTEVGTMTRDELEGIGAEVADAAYSLSEPGVAEPVQSAFGWHVVRVSEINEAVTRSFEDVRPELRAELVEDRAVNRMFELSNNAQDALASGSTVEEVAEEFDLPLQTYEALDASGFKKDGMRAPNAPSPAVLEQAFTTQVGAYPELQPVNDDDYLLVRVDNVTPPALKDFEAVKADVEAALLADRRRQAAAQMAEDLKQRAEAGESIESLAETADAVFRTSDPIGRNGNSAPAIFGQEAMEKAFDGPEGTVFTAVGSDGEDYVVGRVSTITELDPMLDEQGVSQFTQILEQVVSNDILEQYRAELFARYDVELYPAMVARAINPDAQQQF